METREGMFHSSLHKRQGIGRLFGHCASTNILPTMIASHSDKSNADSTSWFASNMHHIADLQISKVLLFQQIKSGKALRLRVWLVGWLVGWLQRWADSNVTMAFEDAQVTKTEMPSKLKCHQNWDITKTKMSQKLNCSQKWNVTKTEMSPQLNCHQNWNVTKTEMSPKLKCHQSWDVTKSDMSPKLKCHKTEISPRLKCHKN